METIEAIVCYVLAAGCAIGFGRFRPRRAPTAAAGAVAVGTLLLLLAAWTDANGGPFVDLEWLPTLGSRLRLELDRLAAPLAVFASLTAAVVLAYAGPYLRHEEATPARMERFSRYFLGFLGGMLSLLLAQDLLVMFVALELTAIFSFFLIELHREESGARRAASLALVVTAGSSLLFLLGTVWIASATGTTLLPELRAAAERGQLPTGAIVCLGLGVLAKSAQVPLHFWLPRAMVAPTPVSAYLHSAALVAAGVFVLARLRTILASVPLLLDAFLVIACASVLLGSVMALTSDHLKRILAFSTIAQMGYILALVALGGDEGAAGAPLAIVAHGLCKAPLFMTAGVVVVGFGVDRLSQARGVLRKMPLLAVASAISAAGLAGLPYTVGFAKDEALLAAAHAKGPLPLVAAAVAAALTFAYICRFWLGLFTGGPSRSEARVSGRIVLPIAFLAVCVVVGGVASELLARTFGEAGGIVAGHAVHLEPASPLALHTTQIAGMCAWGAGALLLVCVLKLRTGGAGRVERVSAVTGFAAWADRAIAAVRRTSQWFHQMELRDLRDRLAAVVVPTALFVGAGLAAGGDFPAELGEVRRKDLPQLGALLVVIASAVCATRARDHLGLVQLLSFVGFGLALSFGVSGAPDVALVILLVETALTLLFLGLLTRLRSETLQRALKVEERRRKLPWGGLLAGAMGCLLSWYALSTTNESAIARQLVELAPEAHAKDVVTAILADFRGLDTAGEATVLAVAILGAAGISWGRDK